MKCGKIKQKQRIKYISSITLSIICTVILSAPSNVSAAPKEAQYASLNYDVVYVRCPRGLEPVNMKDQDSVLNWNGVNDLWLSAANNVYHQPGCDLVLHHSDPDYNGLAAGDPGREEVLVNCDETATDSAICSVVDPNVSFDGRYVVYSKFTDTREFVNDFGVLQLSGVGGHSYMRLYPDGDGPGGTFASRVDGDTHPYNAPAFVYMYDLVNKVEVRISPDDKHFAGRAYPGRDEEWTTNVPVMDTGPFFMSDGRIGFTSNRASGEGLFQLFAMETDGSNIELIGHRAMGDQLHPFTLKDGRVAYTNDDGMLQKVANNNFSLFTVNPDGSDPFILAGKFDATKFTYHYATQLSDGDVVVTLYYNHNNMGLGTLMRFPIDPEGPDFVHVHDQLGLSSGESIPFTEAEIGEDNWMWGGSFTAFARPGEFELTEQSGSGDSQMGLYQSADEHWIHPFNDREVKAYGKFSHPAAAPDNNLLTTYTIGG